MSRPNLKIAGIEIPFQVYPASQRYADLGGATLLRALDGSGIPQQHWRKRSTLIEGSGWAPPALEGLAWMVPFQIACIQPVGITSVGVEVALPAVRRADLPVNEYAHAVVDGRLVDVAVSVAGDLATCAVVAGASAYIVYYYPLLTVVAPRGIESRLDLASAVYGWSLEAEEV